MPIDPRVKEEILAEIRDMLRSHAADRLQARGAPPDDAAAEEGISDEAGGEEEMPAEEPGDSCSVCGAPLNGEDTCPECGEAVARRIPVGDASEEG